MKRPSDLPGTVLTDIEGTTSRISFVKQVLFPYARERLPAFVAAHAQDPEVRGWLQQVAAETGADGSDAVVRALQAWIDADRKHTALKALQGLVWAQGYRDGAYTAHVYSDAAEALRAWHAAGRRIAVYSSGSVTAQKLLFAHSSAGDLGAVVSAWFDTETGGKREAASYARIAQALGAAPADILFLSDVAEELDAARASGLRTVLLDRREDYPEPRTGEATHGHRRIERFDQLALG